MSPATQGLGTLGWLQVGRRIMIIGVCYKATIKMGTLQQVIVHLLYMSHTGVANCAVGRRCWNCIVCGPGIEITWAGEV